MVSKQPLIRRIVIAFVLMTVVVSGIFSVSIVATVHFVEGHLVPLELDGELDNVLAPENQGVLRPRLDGRTQLYATGHGAEFAIPPLFANVETGYSEVTDGDHAYYVMRRTVDGQDYILVQEQHEFEEREVLLYKIVLSGFVLSVLAAWGLGLMLARRVMAPVIRLANQVRHRDQLHPLAPALAPDYPDDEVGRLAASFDSTLGQLRGTLEREQLFTSDVSHELRTPLMIISTSCELLTVSNNLNARQQEQVQRIRRASEDMRDLVETFLILARRKTDKQVPGGEATLASVAQEQIQQWAPAIEEKGLKLSLIEEAPDDGQYNLSFLRTVISNLLRNAMHYTDQGEIRLITGTRGFRVEDSGIGIPEELHESVFQPFVRVNQQRGEGLGLGLSLVKRVCAHQGWQVSVHDGEAGGTVFEVKLA